MSKSFSATGGFTLIELMVVVVVVTILAVITVPMYEQYIMKSKIQTAQAALMSMGVALKQYQQDHLSYVGFCPAPPPTQDFTLSCQGNTASQFTVVASGIGPMAGFGFSLDQNGQQDTTATPSGWIQTATCWISDPQGDCSTE